MSHFTVLVVGPDPETQLAPFHEFACTGEEAFIKDVDQTAEALTSYEKHKSDYKSLVDFVEDWYGAKPVEFGDAPDIAGIHKYHYALLDACGSVTKVVGRSNATVWALKDAAGNVVERVQSDQRPEASEGLRVALIEGEKWDWYLLGGRWTGFFRLRSGALSATVGTPGVLTERAVAGHADQALKRDIDFDSMRRDAAAEAELRWKNYHAIVDLCPPITSWKDLLASRGVDQDSANHADEAEIIKECRAIYGAQPAIKALRTSEEFGWSSPEDFAPTPEEHIRRAVDRSISTYAVLCEGEWMQRGEMGWWGMSRDEMSQEDWNRIVREKLDSLPGDTLLSIYDCHI